MSKQDFLRLSARNRLLWGQPPLGARLLGPSVCCKMDEQCVEFAECE